MIKNGIESYVPVGARLRIEDGQTEWWINDEQCQSVYMRASLTTLSQLEGQTTIALLGDMLELGETLEEHIEPYPLLFH